MPNDDHKVPAKQITIVFVLCAVAAVVLLVVQQLVG